MPKIIRTITTDAPVADVFAYLADFSNAPEWDPGTESSRARDQDGPRLGQVYDLIVTWGDRRLPMVYEITALKRDRLLTLIGDGSTTHAVDTMEFSEVPDGGTSVTYIADIRLKGVLRLAEPFLRRRFAELGDAAEAGLSAALNRLAAGDAS
jgi:Polyketide cyclase / dehydrase and lipid transport